MASFSAAVLITTLGVWLGVTGKDERVLVTYALYVILAGLIVYIPPPVYLAHERVRRDAQEVLGLSGNNPGAPRA